MILLQPTGWQEVRSHWFLVAAEELQSVGQFVVQPVQPGNLFQPGTCEGCTRVSATWFVLNMSKPVDRSRWTFTPVTTPLPTKRSAWRSSTVCAAASASRLMSASCSTRSDTHVSMQMFSIKKKDCSQRVAATLTLILIFQGFYDVLRRNSQLASSIMQTLCSQVRWRTAACVSDDWSVCQVCCANSRFCAFSAEEILRA